MIASFVIPVFKTEQYLPRCLDSLVAQTDGDFEAIVVDDASPDGAAGEIVARYDKRFRYIRQDHNRSTFQAKATGAQAATGDYIVPLDSDDFVGPELVRELRKGIGVEKRCRCRMESKASIVNLNLQPQPDVIVYQMVKEYRGKSYPVKYNHPKARCTGAEALSKLFEGRIFMPVCGKAIRREVFLKAYAELGVGPDFYLNFTDDLCWLLPILFNTKTVSFIPYEGYHYWRHDDSMTKDVMAPERISRLAEQSCRSVDTVIAYSRRLGLDERTVAQVRAQLYPTIRWLMRDMGASREMLVQVFGEELVAAAEAWDAAAGGTLVKMLRHFAKYGMAATVREVISRCRGEEI